MSDSMSDRSYQCFAVVAPGLERLASAELAALGVPRGVLETGGVSFRANSAQLYSANLQLRTASRVIVRLAEFRATAFWELEKRAREVPWETVVAPGVAVDFAVTARKSRLYHQRGIAERLAQAIALRVPGGARNEVEDAQLFVVRVDHDRVTISADSSGALLHQRGYRLASAKAPLRETLAAAMLLGAGWDAGQALVDPLCGSGTIPIEAALLARRIPPGWNRRFGFERWPQFDPKAWHRVRAQAGESILPHAPRSITGADRDAGAIEAARANGVRAGVEADIQFERQTLSHIRRPEGSGWLITNPPYGVRVGEVERLRDLYARIGQLMRGPLAGCCAGILAAHPRLTGQTKLKWEERWRSKNGGIPVRFLVHLPGVSA